MSAVEEALLDAARLEADADVLVLGGDTLALGAQRRLGNGWVYVVRSEVGDLEELLAAAHSAGAAGLAYLVGEASVLPLPDGAVVAALGHVSAEESVLATGVAELARVVAAGGRVALAEPDRPAGDAVAEALETAGFAEVALVEVGHDVLVSATRP